MIPLVCRFWIPLVCRLWIPLVCRFWIPLVRRFWIPYLVDFLAKAALFFFRVTPLFVTAFLLGCVQAAPIDRPTPPAQVVEFVRLGVALDLASEVLHVVLDALAACHFLSPWLQVSSSQA